MNKDSDTINNISKKYLENEMTHKTQVSIINELLKQNIINKSQYDDFMRQNEVESVEQMDESNENEQLSNFSCDSHFENGDIKVLKDYLYKEHKGQFILWLQSVVIEACFAKLIIASPDLFDNNENISEPSVYYSACTY